MAFRPGVWTRTLGLPFAKYGLLYYNSALNASPSAANTTETLLTNAVKQLHVEGLNGLVLDLYHKVTNPTTASQNASTYAVLKDIYGRQYMIIMIDDATISAGDSIDVRRIVVAPLLTEIDHQVYFSSTSLQLAAVKAYAMPVYYQHVHATLSANGEGGIFAAITPKYFAGQVPSTYLNDKCPAVGGVILLNVRSTINTKIDVIVDDQTITSIYVNANETKPLIPIPILFEKWLELYTYNNTTQVADFDIDVILFATVKDEVYLGT